MARSLRTRPQTLYQQGTENSVAGARNVAGQASPGPNLLSKKTGKAAVQAEHGYHHDAQDAVGRVAAVDGSSSRSKVSSNLKKRLSMRYKDGADPLQDHIFRMASGSAIPEMPAMPAEFAREDHRLPSDQQSMMNAALSIPGFSLGQGHRLISTIEDVEDPQEDILALEDQLSSGPSQRSLHASAVTRPGQPFVRARSDGSTADAALSADLQLVSSDRFDPQGYLRAISADSDGARDPLHSSVTRAALLRLKEQASVTLQSSVFTNYGDFISISKEVASLENEMLELKELIRDWSALPASLDTNEAAIEQQHTTVTSSFNSFANGFSALTAAPAGNRLSSRNSVQDLSQVYKAQLQALWENIEGSQKLVPFVPGRHLIAEAPSFVEMNSATYRPRQPVSMFLLDDLLLVTHRKRRQMSSKIQLVADRCFNLSEIVVIDLKDASDLNNAIKIKRGKEVYVYRTDRLDEKKLLLGAFRRVAEELAAKRRQQMSDENNGLKKRESISTFDVSGTEVAPPMTGTEPGKWVSHWSDDVAVAISLREWDTAVTLIENGKEMLAKHPKGDPLHTQLSSRLHQHSPTFLAAISTALSSPSIKKAAVVRYAAYLLRLESGETAREIFLSARSELLKRRSRQIRFEGDVGLYISELALVHFTIIKNTSEWYVSAFKDNRMASGFIKWAALQMEAYANIFRKQVYGSDDSKADPSIIMEALEISRRSAAQLKDVGLDFTFLVEYLLKPADM